MPQCVVVHLSMAKCDGECLIVPECVRLFVCVQVCLSVSECALVCA